MFKETKNIHQHVNWYVSYMNGDEQGMSMIKALQAKIKQYEDLCSNIIGEIELVDVPQELNPYTALESIRGMIQTLPEVSVTVSIFEWKG